MKKCFVMVLLCCLLVAGTVFAKTGTLLVAFGTSMDSARPAIDDIEKAYKKAAGNEPVLLAFTSDIIRNKLAKEGKPVLSVNAAMNELAAQGVTDLKIQSLHIAPAEEYNQLERMVVKNITKNPGVFKTVKVGYPLLVSEKDLDAVVKVVLASLPKDRKPGDAVVLMGHGNDRGPGDLTLAATAAAFHKADPHVWLATVEGSNSFDNVLPKLKASGAKRVWLQPFMIVAGDHARGFLGLPHQGCRDDPHAQPQGPRPAQGHSGHLPQSHPERRCRSRQHEEGGLSEDGIAKESEGEGEPFWRRASPFPSQDFRHYRIPFHGFPCKPKKRSAIRHCPLLKDVPFLQRQAHRKSPFLQKNKIWFPLSYRTETVGEKGGGSGKGERSPSFLRKHQPTTRILP